MSNRTTNAHAPGLDGIRALMVAFVVAYHLGVPFMGGGLLGVSVFFTLSGYLITSILLGSFREHGSLDLKRFWTRRARRLLPALVAVLAVVLGATAVARTAKLALYAKQAFFALVYLANWATIARGDDYFARFDAPGPMDHLWSLAIEEQFYVVWPLVVLAVLVVAGRALGRRSPWPLAALTVVLIVASTLAMAHLHHPNELNNTRAYEGTDARACPILMGALVAMLVPLSDVAGGGRWRRPVLEVVGLLGFAVVIACVTRTDDESPFLYRGGEVLLSASAAALVVAAAHPSTLIGKLLGTAPLRWLGERSYGVYLWHMPVIAFLPLQGPAVLRGALQVGVTLALSALSWVLFEDAIRRRGLRAAFGAPARRVFGIVSFVAIGVLALALWPRLYHEPTDSLEALAAAAEALPPADSSGSPAPPPPSDVPPSDAPLASLTTSCTDVVHLGDSTSIGLVSSFFLPEPTDRLGPRYRAVGVRNFIPEISGARSMVETYKDEPNATTVATRRHDAGFRGCWVFALGTNDPANVAGDVAALSRRIDGMMRRAGSSPVLWATSKTLVTHGPYQNANMEGWNRAVREACDRYPNMRVYDWASEVKDGWFLSDGIHPNTAGCKAKAAGFASALAAAFPSGRPPPSSCIVRSHP